MKDDGSIKQVAKHAGASLASTIQHDLDWAPEKNAAEKMRKHQLYRQTHINYAQQSNVDEVVFNHDLDGSAEVVPEIRDLELKNSMRLRASRVKMPLALADDSAPCAPPASLEAERRPPQPQATAQRLGPQRSRMEGGSRGPSK